MEGIRMFRSPDPVEGNGEKIIDNTENSFDPNVSHIETVSSGHLADEKYKTAMIKFIRENTENFSNLNELQKITYLSGLKNIGHGFRHDSFYPDRITELWKAGKIKEIMPKLNIKSFELEEVIKTYVDYELNEHKNIDEGFLDQFEKQFPLVCAKNGRLQFGPSLNREDGVKDNLDVASLGWLHMPEEYSRLNIYSGLSQGTNPEDAKAADFTKAVSHLYGDSLEESNPLFAKFTTTGNEIRLCSYVNDDLLMWQLKSLSEYFNEPIKVNTIVPEGDNVEIRLFSNGQIGLRSSNESGSGKAETARLLRLITEMQIKPN